MLHHVTHEVLPAQLDPCIAFYGLLGFRPVEAPEGIADRAVWLENGPTQIHLLHTDQAEHPPFGTDLTYPLERYSRFHQTSGKCRLVHEQ